MDTLNTPVQQQETTPVRRTGKLPYIAAAIVVAVVAVAAVRWEQTKAEDVSAKSPAAPSVSNEVVDATPDQLKQIRIEPVREQALGVDLETTGKVGFNEDRTTPVFSPYAGRVVEVLVNKGDLVTAGQPLLVMESADLVAGVNDLSEALAEADKSRISLDAADKAAQRARNLNALEALATKELQSAEADLARARQDQQRAQTAVIVALNRLSLFGKSAEEIDQLERAAPDSIDRRITIRAPLGGTIVDRKVGPGQYLKTDASDPLYLISDLSTVWVNADVYEGYLPQIRPGAPVEIVVTAYPERKFAAHIQTISPTVDPATRTVRVRCLVANAGGMLKPEMFASIRIGSMAKRNVSFVPSNAILTQGSDSFVLVEESPGRFRKRIVSPGKEIEGYTPVEGSLHAGDRVAATGVLLLSSGFDGR